MAVKSISKSIRLSDEVYGYIMDAPGNGFNEKFENIILEAKEAEPERKKRLADYDKNIEKKSREFAQLFDRYRNVDEFFRSFLRMQHQLCDLKELLDKAAPETIQSDQEKES